jgi:hypothetical protein
MDVLDGVEWVFWMAWNGCFGWRGMGVLVGVEWVGVQGFSQRCSVAL